jgi:hypothetical protein
MRPLGLAAFLGFVVLPVAAAAADSCPQPGSEIATDRPDTTNSSLVVPQGSIQQENGVNLNSRDGGQVLDGTNTRLRLGIVPCLEILADVPTYFDALSGRADSGFTNVTPAIKWQISPVPGKIDLSATLGAGLPTGSKAIAGPGVQPYLQFPWSWELSGGWSINGLLTNFVVPADPSTSSRPKRPSLSSARSASAPSCLSNTSATTMCMVDQVVFPFTANGANVAEGHWRPRLGSWWCAHAGKDIRASSATASSGRCADEVDAASKLTVP